jgi:hypothetical protein
MLHDPAFGKLLDRYSDAADAYELTAGALAISHVIPFTELEREKICSTPGEMTTAFEFRRDSTAERAPQLFSRWYGWLWTTRQTEGHHSSQTAPSLPASMLAEACLRLGQAAARITSE